MAGRLKPRTISPLVCGMSPRRTRSKVDLPEPEGPMTDTKEPRGTTKEISRSTNLCLSRRSLKRAQTRAKLTEAEGSVCIILGTSRKERSPDQSVNDEH